MKTSQILGAAIAALAVALGTAHAQSYPTQTVKVIVPFVPGGPVDALARVVVQHLQGRLGQNIIIENRSGGGTTIGAKAVATAKPDGYTLLFVGPNLAYYPVLFPNLDFDPAKGLVPVATVVTWSHVFAVAPSVPAKTVPELVAYACGKIREHGVPRERYEFQMLLGIRRDLQRQVFAEGHPLRVYVPWGTAWCPYFMRRLAERPANLWFVLRSLLAERPASGR